MHSRRLGLLATACTFLCSVAADTYVSPLDSSTRRPDPSNHLQIYTGALVLALERSLVFEAAVLRHQLLALSSMPRSACDAHVSFVTVLGGVQSRYCWWSSKTPVHCRRRLQHAGRALLVHYPVGRPHRCRHRGSARGALRVLPRPEMLHLLLLLRVLRKGEVLCALSAVSQRDARGV